MAIGASVGSVATGRTATSSKPFFSRTRRDAVLDASGPTSIPAPGFAQQGIPVVVAGVVRWLKHFYP